MRFPHPFGLKGRSAPKTTACVAVLSLFASLGAAQTQQQPSDQNPNTADLALLGSTEFLAQAGKLVEKLEQNVQLPPARSDSRLLPLLPPNTVAVAAIPNYGDAAHQALQIFRKELKENAALRNKWATGEMATAGPKIEDSIEKFYQLSEFLGDEILVSGVMDSREPTLLLIAEVRKPGLEKTLQEMIAQFGGKEKAGVRLLGPQDLATAKDKGHGEELLVLVRPDFVVAAIDVASLRSFDARLNKGSHEFLTTPFGKRVAKEYQGGLTLLAAADLQEILKKSPAGTMQDASFQQSGFADMQYLIWEHKKSGAQTVAQAELSFTGPRHGSAAWLGKPAPLPSLDFVSPEAVIAASFSLTSPTQIFEDVKALMGSGPASPFASLPQAEKALGITVKDDLLSLLGGEIAFELDPSASSNPAWKAMLSVKDAGHLQKTLTTLMAVGQIKAEETEDGSITYHALHIPSSPQPYEVDYAFLDGYIIAGSGHSAVAEAIRQHRSGESLAKSTKFQASRPPGHSLEASALLYENPLALVALQMKRYAPRLADSFSSSAKEATPAVICLYGKETAISEASSSEVMDIGGALVVAAIAIPNLLKSKMAANEASAVGSLRTIVTAQITYATAFPKLGFAPSLANLGPDPKGGDESPAHASLLDASLGGPTCSGDAPCTKSGFQFRLRGICKEHRCEAFVAVATPLNENNGSRNFCVTEDGVIRYQRQAPLTTRLTIAECRKWTPLQ